MFLSSSNISSTVVGTCAPVLPVECLLEQGSGGLNEDVLLQDGTMFGVFDGATSLNRETYASGRTGGLLAAETAALAFRRNGASLLDLSARANRLIKEAMEEQKVDFAQKKNLWSTSGAVVRLHDDHFEWCQIGDCLILVLYHDGTHRLLADPPGHDVETLSLWKQLTPKTGECISEVLAEQILKVRHEMNIHYGVFNGEQQAMNFVRSGREELSGVSDILLYTDGLSLPRSRPEEDDDLATFVKLYRQGGLRAIRDRVRHMQRLDPACRIYPRFKSQDDIAAIAIPFYR
jgi:serine/threonine protein phosphatase PrpC